MNEEHPVKSMPAGPLTKQELHDTAVERVHLIAQEFTAGFNFLRDYPKSVTFFGGSRFPETSMYYQKARTLAGRIAKELKYSIFTGGGPGIMEAANRGALEAGGQSLGFTIELNPPQIQNKYMTKHLGFYYFFSRKVCMAFSAEAYIFFPGGLGTLNEFFEITTLIQTGKIEKMPVILFGSEFWNTLDEYMKKELLSRDTITAPDLQLYSITDDMDRVLETIRVAPVHNGIQFVHHHLEEPILES